MICWETSRPLRTTFLRRWRTAHHRRSLRPITSTRSLDRVAVVLAAIMARPRRQRWRNPAVSPSTALEIFISRIPMTTGYGKWMPTASSRLLLATALPVFRAMGRKPRPPRWNAPNGITFDKAGNLYIADSNNGRIRKVGTDGIITTVAGNGTNPFSGDNGLATAASLLYPEGVTTDGAGKLYIADSNHLVIRKVDANGIITTVAGNGKSEFSGDNGPGDLGGNSLAGRRGVGRCRGICSSRIPSTTSVCAK